MPVILADPELWRAWLDRSISPKEALTLCEPLAGERMSATTASQAVNSVGSPEGPELLVAGTPAGSLDAEVGQLSLARVASPNGSAAKRKVASRQSKAH